MAAKRSLVVIFWISDALMGEKLGGFFDAASQPFFARAKDEAWGEVPATPGGWPALERSPWVVDRKRPFAGWRHALSYLSNYTHRVTISARRIEAVDAAARMATFRARDYARGNKATRHPSMPERGRIAPLEVRMTIYLKCKEHESARHD